MKHDGIISAKGLPSSFAGKEPGGRRSAIKAMGYAEVEEVDAATW